MPPRSLLSRGPFSLTLPDTQYPGVIPDGSSGGLSDDLLPWLVNVDVFMTPVSHVGFGGYFTNSSDVYNGATLNVGNLNDEISFDVVLARGTWTIEIMYRKRNTGGIVATLIDGSPVGSFDTYDSVGVFNVRSQITGIVVDQSGKKRLTLRLTSKNASSLGYTFYLQHIQFRRTA